MTGFLKPTKLLSFLKKKQVNEFTNKKIVIKLNFRIKKVVFIAVIKQYLNTNSQNPFF